MSDPSVFLKYAWFVLFGCGLLFASWVKALLFAFGPVL